MRDMKDTQRQLAPLVLHPTEFVTNTSENNNILPPLSRVVGHSVLLHVQPPTGAMHMHGFDLELPRPAVDPDGDPLVYLPCK